MLANISFSGKIIVSRWVLTAKSFELWNSLYGKEVKPIRNKCNLFLVLRHEPSDEKKLVSSVM
jgi:hypothetical protein